MGISFLFRGFGGNMFMFAVTTSNMYL